MLCPGCQKEVENDRATSVRIEIRTGKTGADYGITYCKPCGETLMRLFPEAIGEGVMNLLSDMLTGKRPQKLELSKELVRTIGNTIDIKPMLLEAVIENIFEQHRVPGDPEDEKVTFDNRDQAVAFVVNRLRHLY
jgi:hypothetical protein